MPPAVLRAIGKRQMLDAKTIQGQGRYFDNKSSQPAAVADKRQQEVKVGSKSYEARAKKFDTKVPGATPFQSKLKEYELMAQTVGMFGEISKDGESILEIAAWKRADEYCTFFASKPRWPSRGSSSRCTVRSDTATCYTSCGTSGTTWSSWSSRVVGRTSRSRTHDAADGHR